MLCIYHSADSDGKCSGAIVKNKFPECELIGMNYGESFPFDKIKKDEVVYMVDFVFQPFSLMDDILKITPNLIWIDHHISAIKEYEASGLKIEGLREVGKAACELTWMYLYQTQDVPYCVKLLSLYDIWNHTDPNVLDFQNGLWLENTYPDSPIWKDIFDSEPSFYNPILENGKIILRYRTLEDTRYVKSCSFEAEFEGYKCIVVNKMYTSSKVFDSIWDETKYDMMVIFGYRKGYWHVSLYSTKASVDVSILAKKYGGGGHKGAGGMELNMDDMIKIGLI